MTLGMYRTNRQKGFTLLEVMMVVAIMGILAASAVYNNAKSQKKARRVEVTLGLDKIKEAQYVHYLEYGDYAGSFDDLVFQTSVGGQLSATVYQGKAYQYTLSQPWGADSYYVSAAGNIDGDEFLDLWVLEAGRFN